MRNGETEKTAELQSHLYELQSHPVDDRQRSSYAVDSATWLKHTSVITDDAVCIVAMLNNMEIFQPAACLSDKNFGDRSAMVEGHNVETEALLEKMKEYLGDEMVTDGDSMQYVC